MEAFVVAGEGGDHVGQAAQGQSVDALHHRRAAVRHLCIGGVAENADEHDHLAVRGLGLLRLPEEVVPHQVPVGALRPAAPEGLHELGVEGNEDEARVDHVTRGHPVAVAPVVEPRDAPRDRGQLLRTAIAPHREPHRLSRLLEVEQVLEGDPRVPGPDAPVVRHRDPVDGQDHVPGLDHSIRGPARRHEVHHHPALPLGQTPFAAVDRREERCRLEARVGEAVVPPVLEIGQEVPDHRHRDEEAHVVEAGVALEGHPDHVPLLHDRSPAVPGGDGGVRLHHEVRVDAAVHVASRLHAGDDAGGGGDVLAAEREAIGLHAAPRVRDVAQGQRPQALGEGGGFHAQHRQVAVVAPRLHRGHVGVGLVGPPHEHLAGVAHDMGVRDHAPALDQEPAAEARLHRLLFPGQAPVESGPVDVHQQDRTGDRGLGGRGGRGGQDEGG